MKIIIGILIFCVIVVVHELGHMLVAKANHIEVREFWVGFGPLLCSFTKGGTKYCLRAIPFGGACVFDLPEEEAEDGNKESATSDLNEAAAEPGVTEVEGVKIDSKYAGRKGKLLNDASALAKIATLFAGPFFNFVLAFILGIVVMAYSVIPSTRINEVVADSPAMAAGLEAGDTIVKINGSRVYMYPEVSVAIQLGVGKPLSLEYEHDGKRIKTELIPTLNEETGTYMIGVVFGGDEVEANKSALTVLSDSYKYVRYMIKVTYQSLGMLFKGAASVKDMSGPVGIVSVVADEYDAAASISVLAVVVSMLNIAVLLSANLGVLNLLPLPALDGGRLVFAIYELITGNKPSQKVEGFVHFIGSALLILLAIYIVFNDIIKLFGM